MRVAQIQKIRQLVVVGAALARRGYDHDAARRIRFYYTFDFSELFRPGDRGAAEFGYLQHIPYSSMAAKKTAAPLSRSALTRACMSATARASVTPRQSAPSSSFSVKGSASAQEAGRRT